MKKPSKSDCTIAVSAAMAASAVFVLTLLNCTPATLDPLSPLTVQAYALRTAGGFAFLAGFTAFLIGVVWQEVRLGGPELD